MKGGVSHQPQSVGLWGFPFQLVTVPKAPNCQGTLNSWAELWALQPFSHITAGNLSLSHMADLINSQLQGVELWPFDFRAGIQSYPLPIAPMGKMKPGDLPKNESPSRQLSTVSSTATALSDCIA